MLYSKDKVPEKSYRILSDYCNTDQITDHFAPYCIKLSNSAMNDIRVLEDTLCLCREQNFLLGAPHTSFYH